MLPQERVRVSRIDRNTGRYRTGQEMELIARERTEELAKEIIENGEEINYQEERESVRNSEARYVHSPLEVEREDGYIRYRKAYIGSHKVWTELGKEWRIRTTLKERCKLVGKEQLEELERIKDCRGTAGEKIEKALEATDGGYHHEELADLLGYAPRTIKSFKPEGTELDRDVAGFSVYRLRK